MQTFWKTREKNGEIVIVSLKNCVRYFFTFWYETDFYILSMWHSVWCIVFTLTVKYRKMGSKMDAQMLTSAATSLCSTLHLDWSPHMSHQRLHACFMYVSRWIKWSAEERSMCPADDSESLVSPLKPPPPYLPPLLKKAISTSHINGPTLQSKARQ